MSRTFSPLRYIFTKNIVLITGVHGSGKSMLTPIVSSLACCENPRKEFTLGHIQALFHYGKISKDVAKYMLGAKIDFMLYDSLIGRNINMRFGDESSLWYASNPGSLFSRLNRKKGKDIIDNDIIRENANFLIDTHNSIWHSELWFECFPKIKIINMQRHPIDVINNWYKNGLGADIWENKLNQALTLQWENKLVPYYAYGWEEQYINSSPIERVILMYDKVMKKHVESMNKIGKVNQRKILNVYFEDMALHPSKNIDRICNLLQTVETLDTPISKAQERVPRKLDKADRFDKLTQISKLVGDDYIDIVNMHSRTYEEICLSSKL